MQYKLQRVEDVVVVMLEGKLLSEQETAAIKTNIADELTGGKMKFIIEEVPIIFMDRKEGHSKMNSGIFSEALLGVIEMKIN